MSYLVRENFKIDVGFSVTGADVLNAVNDTNQFLRTYLKFYTKVIVLKWNAIFVAAWIICKNSELFSPTFRSGSFLSLQLLLN